MYLAPLREPEENELQWNVRFGQAAAGRFWMRTDGGREAELRYQGKGAGLWMGRENDWDRGGRPSARDHV